MRRILPLLLIASLALFATVASAQAAATADTVIRDAADGVIDGHYSLSLLRAANAKIPAQQREYYGWDDAYRAAVLKASAPKPSTPVAAVPPVQPVDSNVNGKIDPGERAQAAFATVKNQLKADKGATLTPTAGDNPNGVPNQRPSAGAASVKKVNTSHDKLYVALIVFVLAMLLGLTIWRVIVNRRRNHGDPRAVHDEFAAENDGRDDIAHDARFDGRDDAPTETLPETDADHPNPDGGISDQGPDDPRA